MGRSIFRIRRKGYVKKFKGSKPKKVSSVIGIGGDVDAKLWSLVQETLKKENEKGDGKFTQRMILEDGLRLYLNTRGVKYE